MHARNSLRLIVVASLLLLLVAVSVLAILWARLDVDAFGQVLLAQVSDHLGWDIRADDVSLSFFPPGLTLVGIRVHAPGSGEAGILLAARFLHARLGLRSLMRGKPSLSSLVLEGVIAEFRQEESGKWSLSIPQEGNSGDGLSLETAGVSESRVLVKPAAMAALKFSDVVVSLRDVSLEEAFPFEVECRVQEQGRLNVQGLLGPGAATTGVPELLSARFSVEQVEVPYLQGSSLKLSGAGQLRLQEQETRIEGNLTVTPGERLSEAYPWQVEGRARLGNVQLSSPDNGESLAVESMQLDLGEDLATLTLGGVSLDGDPLRLELAMTGMPDRRISVALTGRRFSPSAWLHFLSGWRAKDGRPGDLALAVARRLTGSGQVQLQTIGRQGLHLGPLEGTVEFAGNTVRADFPGFEFYDGRSSLFVRGDLGGDEPRFDVEGKLVDVDVDKLLSAANYGDRLLGRLQASFALKSALSAPVGTGHLEVTNGLLKALDPGGGLANLGRTIGVRFPSGDFFLERLSASFRLADRRVTTDDLILQIPELSVTAVGGISLDQEIELDALARLKPETVERPKSALGGLVAILVQGLPVSRHGDVLFPFKIRGTLSRPRYSPDLARLAEIEAGQLPPSSGSRPH